MSEQVSQQVTVELRGSGHHDRTERAIPVIEALTAAGLRCFVRTDLRPRLADDMRALIDAGAARVRLSAEGLTGDLAADDGGPEPEGADECDVVVVLVPAATAEIVVVGTGPDAERTRSVLNIG